MSDLNVDQMLGLARSSVEDEAKKLISMVRFSDLTTHEVIALAAALRPAYERVMDDRRPPGRVLKLVPLVPAEPGR
ncbi:hypothetical protein [Mycolicibacterium wolinskyi]|uniref:hypothetical protein n=1 Tax=Mycolicibacterium wolinskyi TaxID=59750 RepID=UPI0039177F3E